MDCANRQQQARRWQAAAGQVMVAGDKGHRRAWITRREQYGASGLSARGVSQIAALNRRRRVRGYGLKTHCKRGHAFTDANTLVSAGVRYCRACKALRERGRPLWVAVAGARVSLAAHDAYYLRERQRLRDVMVAAHPDKGGTSKRFLAARAAYEAWMAREAVWYAAVSVAPPTRRRDVLAQAS